MVYNGYYKVMSNSPKIGHLTTPAAFTPEFVLGGSLVFVAFEMGARHHPFESILGVFNLAQDLSTLNKDIQQWRLLRVRHITNCRIHEMFHALLYSGHTQIPVPQDFPCITFSPFVLRSPDYSHLPDQGQLDRVETEPPGTGMTDAHRIHWFFFPVLRSMCWFSFVDLSKFSRHTQSDGASLGTKQCASETIEWKARWKGDGQPLCP